MICVSSPCQHGCVENLQLFYCMWRRRRDYPMSVIPDKTKLASPHVNLSSLIAHAFNIFQTLWGFRIRHVWGGFSDPPPVFTCFHLKWHLWADGPGMSGVSETQQLLQMSRSSWLQSSVPTSAHTHTRTNERARAHTHTHGVSLSVDRPQNR